MEQLRQLIKVGCNVDQLVDRLSSKQDVAGSNPAVIKMQRLPRLSVKSI
jgi:hypothetical protein